MIVVLQNIAEGCQFVKIEAGIVVGCTKLLLVWCIFMYACTLHCVTDEGSWTVKLICQTYMSTKASLRM